MAPPVSNLAPPVHKLALPVSHWAPKPSLRAEWRAALSQSSAERTNYALRLAAVVMLTVLVAETFQTLEPSLSAYLPFLMVKPERVGSIATALALLIVVALLLGLLLLVAGALTDNNMLRLAVMAGLSLALCFLASASKLGGLALMVAMVAVYVIALMPMSPVGELTTRAFLHAGLMVAIPAGATILVNLVAGPAPRRLLEAQLAENLRVVAEIFTDQNPEAQKNLRQSLRRQSAEAEKFLKAARLEKTSPPEELAALAQAARASFGLMALAESALHDPQLRLEPKDSAQLAQILAQMAALLARGQIPIEVAFWPEPGVLAGEIAQTLKIFGSTNPKVSLAPPAPEKNPAFSSQTLFPIRFMPNMPPKSLWRRWAVTGFTPC